MDVAGGHARSYFEMAPASLVARLTTNLVAGYNTYGFDEKGQFSELSRINKNDLPGNEFWLGGEIARNMSATNTNALWGKASCFTITRRSSCQTSLRYFSKQRAANMETMWLHVRAPFAVFRWLQAGVYRATHPVMPPSAAYGLLLNLGVIDMRDAVAGPMTLIRSDVPLLRLAIGVVTPAERCSLYQQLHTYPVGNSGVEFKSRRMGPSIGLPLYGGKCWLGWIVSSGHNPMT